MTTRPKAKLIVNPSAGCGSTGRKWKRIHEYLIKSGLSFDFVHTEGRGHAMELAMEAAHEEYEMVIAAGGDGTLNEVVNGLLDSGNTKDTTLGVLNTGTGCDFARFLGVSRDYRLASLHLVNPRKVRADVGVVECQKEGRAIRRYYISAAGMGMDGEVVETAVKGPRVIHGNLPYFFGILQSLGTYHNKDIRIHLDDNVEDIRICSVIMANGGFYAGGMHIAPDANLQDGLFEVMILGDIGKLELMQVFPSAYKGDHVTHPKVRIEKAAQVIIESSERIMVQADGEFVGEGPASFKIIPAALNIAI